MPIDFSIQQGSLILGNDATPSVLIGHFDRSTGSVNYTDVSDKHLSHNADTVVEIYLRSSKAVGRLWLRKVASSHTDQRRLFGSTTFPRQKGLRRARKRTVSFLV